MDSYDPDTPGNSDDWLQLDEGDRIELVSSYHCRKKVHLHRLGADGAKGLARRGSRRMLGGPERLRMTISLLAAAVHAGWLVVEWRGGCITIEKPWRQWRLEASARNCDRHSSTVWDVANVIEAIGLVLGFLGFGCIAAHTQLIGLVGFTLLLLGLAIRGTAIRTLGILFTGVVLIRRDHQLVRHGLYRYVRHPGYTGLIIAHLGLGLSFASWVSVAFSTMPYLIATAYRIHVEEQALRQAFGAEYVAYSAETWRLIPCLY